MAITIPQKLRKHLKDDNCKWERRIGTLIEKLEPILDQTPEFFPQYTNHGLKHVETVLKMTAELIPGKSLGKNALSSRDIACLIAAILIHDLGMFLKPDGLTMLMAPEWDQHRLSDLDKSSWSDAWDQYITSTKRLPVSQKIRCFGKDLTVEHITLDKDKMVYDDKLVIGEFLRRHHPRLAYEIAVAGLPGSTPQKFLENSGFDKTDCSIIGLMARSHGMPLREVEEYLGSNAHHSNLPVYYLMSVLRLADYLDASEDRAPMVRLKQEGLTSPLSQEEWALNQCFKIDSSRWYPETKNYSIDATPNSSSEFARLEKWLKDVQRELDQCWAILAEKYPNSKLRLSIHRIKCTMYEGLNYKTLSGNILPREVKVTANPEIVKLMMEPLYGDDPTYGVRELLQNAVDACLEREQWEKTHKDGDPNYKGLVDIRIENDVFTITDNGMGMNEDVLLNYYLSAGSSYRSSDAWMAANAPDGKSQVARTGKFGVGFLAAFLLGDEVEVHTQHREDEKGYHFTFSQESSPLDIQCADRTNPYAAEVNDPTHAGTTITIRLKESAIDGFNSKVCQYPLHSWYAFDEPKVRYFYYGAELHHQGLSLHRDPTKNGDWLTLPTKDFALYQWKPNISTSNSEFYCNGIRIYTNYINLSKDELYHPLPHVSITDKNGNLDVKLSRNALRTFPLARELYRELYRLYIAQLLLTPWDSEEHYQQNCTSGFNFFGGHPSNTPFLLSKRGFTLNHACVLPLLELKDYVILCIENTNTRGKIQNALDALQQDTPFSIISHDQNIGTTGAPSFSWRNPVPFFDKLLLGHNQMFDSSGIRYSLYDCCDSLWIHKDFEFLMSHFPPEIQNNMTEFEEIYDVHLTGLHSEVPIDRSKFQTSDFFVAIHLVNNFEFHGLDRSQFTQAIREVLIPESDYPYQDLWIPFDMDERKKKFRTVFEDLSGYMEYINNHPIE